MATCPSLWGMVSALDLVFKDDLESVDTGSLSGYESLGKEFKNENALANSDGKKQKGKPA
jgi:hypothetical protein